MGFLQENCSFGVFSQEIINHCLPFDCGNPDLNDFFINDSQNYSKELLGKSYCFFLDSNPEEVVCAFTISNDSIKVNFLPNSRKKKVSKHIPRQKQFRSYPAVLIGRLGVNEKYKGKGVGRDLLDFIKAWFIDSNNKTGCRFLAVDAYNQDGPITFYSKNGFEFLFSTEDQEKEYTGLEGENELKTRLMFFGLIVLSSE